MARTYSTQAFGLLLPMLLAAAAPLALGCGGTDADTIGASVDNQTEWVAPAEGSCEALGMLTVANEATLEELDDDVRLDRRAAEKIVAARPIETIAALDAVAFVGPSALTRILAYAEAEGHLAGCAVAGELGLISDLDKTVIPHADPDLSLPPYPGVTALYELLELRQGGGAGDVYYVTARTPDGVTDIPAYLETHGVPSGPIETGVSGVPWVAQTEKIADCSRILDDTGEQRFILFGDSSHRDPEVYKAIVAAYPDRILAGFIHKVNATVAPHRVEGLHLHQSYAEVAAILYGLGALTRDEARAVMESARDEGLAITDETIQALLDAQAP